MSPQTFSGIRIEGARTHNLKNLTLEIPRNQFVVITGPSGSGKSSLAFDTLFAEGQRQYLESLSIHSRQFLRQLDRPDVDRITGLQPTVAIHQRGRTVNSRSTVGTLTEIYDFLRLLYARCGLVHCYQCNRPIQQTPLTRIVEALMALPENTRLMLLAPQKAGNRYDELFQKIVKAGFFRVRVDGQFCDLEQPPKLDAGTPHDIEIVIDRLVIKEENRTRLAESLQLALKHGEDSVIAVYETERDHWTDLPFCTRYACPHCQISYGELEPRTFSFNSPYGACPKCEGIGCAECEGSRLRAEARSVTFAGRRIHEICALPIEETLVFLDGRRQTADSSKDGGVAAGSLSSAVPHEIAEPIVAQIIPRLEFLCRIGLSYLTLSRPVDTLSGGELQRVRLATGLGGGLTGVCYVLDEPTIGLHPRDNQRLIEAIRALQQQGNTVIVVEHDDAVIQEADYRIEIGPGSGRFGGELIDSRRQTAGGSRKGGVAVSFFSSAAVCCLPSAISPPPSAISPPLSPVSPPPSFLTLENVTTHNLKNVTVSFPLQKLTCVTGVSGSGKSSLINETLVPLVRQQWKDGRRQTADSSRGKKNDGNAATSAAVCRLPSVVSPPPAPVPQLIEVDQTPLGRSSRSNPATYSGLFDELRKLFASTKDAKRRGYKASRFSFNAGGGRCETCQGQGTQKIETDFLENYHIVCPACNGKRFNRQTLAVKYKGKSIAEVLEMSIEESALFFENIPPVARILQAMLKIGLGYLALGQPSSMLSGGEAQRVKLATELAKPETGNTLYILDEPTTGLHRSDVGRLLEVLSELTAKGNTVIVIEHHLDVMAHSDWMIDLGPEGGERGGYILATGTPEQIAALEDNGTGTFLRQHLRWNLR